MHTYKETDSYFVDQVNFQESEVVYDMTLAIKVEIVIYDAKLQFNKGKLLCFPIVKL